MQKKLIDINIDFPKTLVVNNVTSFPVENLVKLILFKGFNITDIQVDVAPYRGASLSTEDIEIQGFLQKNKFEEHKYIIFLTKDFNMSLKKFLFHECSHIAQYENKELEDISETVVKFKGKLIDFKKDTDYINRLHEVDARNKAKKLEEILKNYKI